MNISNEKQAAELMNMLVTALLCVACRPELSAEQQEKAVAEYCLRHRAEPSKYGWKIDFLHQYQWPSTHKMMDNALQSGVPYTFLLATYNTSRRKI